MPKVRDLKKDVKQMGHLFLNECYTQMMFTPSLNQEWILDIISDTMEFQDETLRKISTRGLSGVDYQVIASNYFEGIVELADRLNSLEYWFYINT